MIWVCFGKILDNDIIICYFFIVECKIEGFGGGGGGVIFGVWIF